ncbi:cytochrome c-type biogenesis protein CcmH [Alicyclobacillus sp. SO9]|uniref:cytochrome c-type biogenesis protein n=1 Tax=Alicyclobacillus sp. SO9 TaxID=2665646 RepID=UPI0018E7607F|nr:cytochrome c-type biogenesis protein CcmH [Alicyclobacillus sp. SO9]QQE76941.1 cytochrome c-type biogenesis protein CcmH [Alicyclobacillus sp. SO9]
MAQKRGKMRLWIAGIVLVTLVTTTGAVWYSVHRHSTQKNLQQEVLAIAAQLRVPSEQDTMTVATSPETVAQHMRYEIQADLLKGQHRQQILSEMVHEYGNQVLAAPSGRGFGGLVWTIPIAALILGLTGLAIYFLRNARPTVGADTMAVSVTAGNSDKKSLPSTGTVNHHKSTHLDATIEKTLRDYL